MKIFILLLSLIGCFVGCAHNRGNAGGADDPDQIVVHRSVNTVPDGTSTRPGSAH